MTIPQLLSDPSFYNWARQQNEQDVAYWETWRAQHPEFAERMDEARLLLTGLEFNKKPVPEAEKTEAWNALKQQLHQPTRSIHYSQRSWWAVAAALTFLLSAGWWLFLRPAPVLMEIVHTGFSEIRTLNLPDGSTVTLNANSELRYPKHWKAGETRQLYLSGEAFFKVQRKLGKERFFVLLDQVEVEVLGTSFNINARRNGPVVSLVEGKASVRIRSGGAQTVLKPGETAYVTATQQIRVEPGETAMQTSWKDHKWIFSHTSMEQVLQRIEDEFGLKAVGVAPGLQEKQVSGQVSTHEKATLFKALEVLLDVDITESGTTISMVKRE